MCLGKGMWLVLCVCCSVQFCCLFFFVTRLRVGSCELIGCGGHELLLLHRRGRAHHLMFEIGIGGKKQTRNSPAGAALCRHAGVILEDDVAVVVKVKKRQRRQDVGHAARSRHFRMAADGVNDTLDSCVIRRIQLLIHNQ